MKPSQEYTIRILESEDFDLLPYNGVRDALGLSDTRKKIAFIRKTGVKDMDMGTIRHEFDELMQQTSPHEIDGIRYKSGGGLGKILGPVIGTIVGLFNPALGVAVGAAISGGTQAHSQAVKPEKYGSGFGGIAKSAAIGGLGAYGGTSLINAGRAAANSATLAGGQAAVKTAGLGGGPGTAATFAKGAGGVSSGAKTVAGLKGIGGAALPSVGTSAVSSLFSPATPKNDPNVLLGYDPGASGFIPSEATQAFYPTETFTGALSKEDFNRSLAALDRNTRSQEKGIIDAFRGRSLAGDTAYSRALSNVRTGAKTAREQFLEDQRKLGSTFV